MAKKTHLKVRMVPESNPDSKFIYYAKKPTKGEKAKEKLNWEPEYKNIEEIVKTAWNWHSKNKAPMCQPLNNHMMIKKQ